MTFPHQHFRFGVRSLYPAHVVASGSFVVYICHSICLNFPLLPKQSNSILHSYTTLSFSTFLSHALSYLCRPLNTVAFYTLGCKLNFAETSTIGRSLGSAGYRTVAFGDGADVYVINTCSVTDHADRKCKKVVREALKFNASAKVVIIGCYAQLKPQEIAAIPGVSMVLGAAEKFNLTEHLNALKKAESTVVKAGDVREAHDFVAGFSINDRTRTFFKVQDGCNYFCSFCTIPLARGLSRSQSIAETMQKALELNDGSVKEIVLTGVNIGDFGKQSKERLIDLLKVMDDELIEVPRIRISSIEPNLLSDDIIYFVAGSRRFMPHFHVPLQSGSNTILKAMRRRYQRELYAERVGHIKTAMPHASIGVDVIVGFPGETQEEFLETYHFLNELSISYLHVFPYSSRPNTRAEQMPGHLPERIKHERVKMLRILSDKKKRAFYEQFTGTTRPVLWEAATDGISMSGFTDNYLKVTAPFDPLHTNEIVPTEMLNITPQLEMAGDISIFAHH